ncbi:MAG TPA: alpha/beta hydrolase family protein [Bryobacteraceae bacterium]|nr:alpha/beta hydrolase family protein [Bryobacteraceae bacterium]
MTRVYARWIDRWERHLASRDSNRVVRPFEWGTEWLARIGYPACPADANGNSVHCVSRFVSEALADSDRFYSYEPVRDYRLRGNLLTFTSPVASPYPENNTVHARWFPAVRNRGRALVVLPQWNSGADGHLGLAQLLNKFGISALRMTMAYHAERMPAELERADYHVSSNIGRTIHASRQSIIDTRACLDWLEQQGYSRVGILGTSLGSCVAAITTAHDRRVRAGIFNHVSMYFSDVVWTGLSTQHVRRGFGNDVNQDDLRRFWSVISPAPYLEKFCGRDLRSLLVWAPFDTSFLPVYSKQVLQRFRELKLPHETLKLPCAHYTTGRFPFNWIDGLAMCRFASRYL